MIKPTSRAAFDELVNSGKLSKKRRAVLLTVACSSSPVLTRRYIAHVLNEQASTISGVVNGLIKLGHLTVTRDPITCPITKRQVEGLEFSVPTRIPVYELAPSGGCLECAFKDKRPFCVKQVADAGLERFGCLLSTEHRWAEVRA